MRLSRTHVEQLLGYLECAGCRLPAQRSRFLVDVWLDALGDADPVEVRQAARSYVRQGGPRFPTPGEILALRPRRRREQIRAEEDLEAALLAACRLAEASEYDVYAGDTVTTGRELWERGLARRWPGGPPAGFIAAVQALGGRSSLRMLSYDEMPSARKAWREAWQRATSAESAMRELREVGRIETSAQAEKGDG